MKKRSFRFNLAILSLMVDEMFSKEWNEKIESGNVSHSCEFL